MSDNMERLQDLAQHIRDMDSGSGDAERIQWALDTIEALQAKVDELMVTVKGLRSQTTRMMGAGDE